jgi:membrane protein DedA with SNARE-associated domain
MISVFVSTYGYLAVFLGTLFEGETVLLAAGYAAQRGMLHWETVVIVAFLGGTLGDQLAFLLGRWKGSSLIRRVPRLASRVATVHALLERHHVLIILTIRFLYGLRIAGPVVLGTSAIPFWRFSLLNIIGAAIWATAITAAGYYFGLALDVFLADLHEFEHLVLLVLLGVGFFVTWWLHRQASRWNDSSR